MSTTVDQRVVEMRFDNQNFEKNVSTTMSTLDKLNQKLAMKGATDGLSEVDKAAKKVDMSSLGRGVETVQAKFSALQVMAVTALANITNSAVNAGKQLVMSLSVDQISAGWEKFGNKTTSVATLKAQGFAVEEINEQLERLNWFTDETSYNYVDMVENIAKFTATGKGLTESVNAMQGIATWAALSGQNASKASSAMYQLSQALGAGVMRKEDYKSIQNVSMDTTEFRQKALDAAVALGTLKKNADGTYTSLKATSSAGQEAFSIEQFADRLTEGAWFTSDVMMQVFGEYSAAVDEIYKVTEEKGMLASEVIDEIHTKAETEGISTNEAIKALGYNFDEFALKAFEAGQKARTFGDAIDSVKDAVSTGWMKSFEIIFGDADEATELWTDLANAMWDAFASGGEARNEMLAEWKELGGRDDLIEAFWNTWEGVASVINTVKEAFHDIFPALTAEKLVAFTKGLNELTAKLTLSETTSDNLRRTFKGLFAILDIVIQAHVALFKALKPAFDKLKEWGVVVLETTAGWGDWLSNLNDTIRETDAFGNAFDKVKDALVKFGTKVKNVFSTIGKWISPLFEALKKLGKSFTEAFDGIADRVGDRLNPVATVCSFIKEVFLALGRAIDKAFPFIMKAMTGLINVMRSLFDTISDAFQNADYSKLFDTANGGIIAAIGVFIAKFIKSGGKLLDSCSGFIDNFKDILGSVKDVLNGFSESLKAKALKEAAIAIGILAASLFVISLIDSEKLTTSLTAVAALFGELMIAMKIFGKITEGNEFKGINKVTRAMKGLATALVIMAVAMKILGTMTWEEMAIGLIATVGGLAALVGAVNLLPEKKVNKAARAIKTMAKAIVILAVGMLLMSTMSWAELARGLTATVGGLAAMVGALHLLPKNVGMKAYGIMIMATALVILAGALKIMATMSWEEIAKGLVTLGVALIAIVGAMQLSKKAIAGAIAIRIIAPALLILAGVMKILATMTWGEIAKGLTAIAGSLVILAAAMLVMKKAVAGAYAMRVAAAAILILTPALKMLGGMSWGDIARSLVAIAGAFTVLGIAAKILAPMTKSIYKLSGALAVLGLACVLIGAGVTLVGIGLTSIAGGAASIAVALVTILSSIISLIPYFLEQVGVGILRICEIIGNGGASLFKAAKALILAAVDALVACVPALIDGLFVIIDSLLKSLVTYIPSIVSSIFDFLIAIIVEIGNRAPELIQALVDMIMKVLTGTIDALKSVDPDILVNGIQAVGFMTALLGALALVAALAPAAMLGVVGFGLVIAELAFVLAAIGKLAEIPGLTMLVEGSTGLLQAIGTGIGRFVGGLIGGLAEGMTSALPQIATDLSTFMNNIKPFIEGASAIDPSSLKGVAALAGVIMALTTAEILNGLASWLTGGSSIVQFGEDIASLGPNLKKFADSVADVDPAVITASASAAQALAEMTRRIPNEGGVASWFAGENSISKWGDELVTLGEGLKAYSDAIVGFDPEAVSASAAAATALAEMTHCIPNEGGVAAWFAGENSISKFGDDIIVLGEGLKAYSDAVTGIDNEAIKNSAGAATALAEMTHCIPNEGGVAAWFAGENSISKFGTDIVILGLGLKCYAAAVANVDPEAVKASVVAAKALAEMTQEIPNEGGVAAWFAGENSISKFGTDIVTLGEGLRDYALAVAGVDPEAVLASVGAAKALAEMTQSIPNEGGVVSWFAGDNSVATFAANLTPLGQGLKSFADETAGIDPATVTAAANAAKSIADMASVIPNEGGVVAWFAGDNSIASFASQLGGLGVGLYWFGYYTKGVDPATITAAANAAKSLAEMTRVIPNEGGVVAWFAGENSMATWAGGLKDLGTGLKDFATETEGITADTVAAACAAATSIAEMTKTIPTEGGVKGWLCGDYAIATFATNLKDLGTGIKDFASETSEITPDSVIAAANAAKAIAQMTSYIPTEGGVKAWFAGETSIANFADKLGDLGAGIKAFDTEVKNITVAQVEAGANAAKTLAQMADTTPKNTDKIVDFGTNLETFATSLSSYFSTMSGVTEDTISIARKAVNAVKSIGDGLDSGAIKSAAKAIEDMVDALKKTAKVESTAADGFAAAIKKLGETDIEALLTIFEGAGDKLKTAGEEVITKFVEGLESKSDDVTTAGETATKNLTDAINDGRATATTACTNLGEACALAIENTTGKFLSAGGYVVKGFASGVAINTYIAKKAARAMARAAADAAEDELDINSPSKVGEDIGGFFGMGFVNKIGEYAEKAYDASSTMAQYATNGLSNAISKISEAVSTDIDAQPTIRPVLDLSDVKAGARTIGSMFGTGSVGVMANIGAISTMMNQRSQNGTNADVVSAIDKLNKKMDNLGNTSYNINGVTYDDGSNISEAVETIVRAARIGRRV